MAMPNTPCPICHTPYVITSSSHSDLHWHLPRPYANTPPRTLHEDDTDVDMAGAGQGQPQTRSDWRGRSWCRNIRIASNIQVVTHRFSSTNSPRTLRSPHAVPHHLVWWSRDMSSRCTTCLYALPHPRPHPHVALTSMARPSLCQHT
jgi:hypothetical protein